MKKMLPTLALLIIANTSYAMEKTTNQLPITTPQSHTPRHSAFVEFLLKARKAFIKCYSCPCCTKCCGEDETSSIADKL